MMNNKNSITVADPDAFNKTVDLVRIISNSCKFIIDSDGLTVNVKNQIARLSLTTNAVFSEKCIEFCTNELSNLKVLLDSATNHSKEQEDGNDGEEDNLILTYESPFLRIKSGDFTADFMSCKEEIIKDNLAKEITSVLNTVYEISVFKRNLNRLRKYFSMFSNVSSTRITLSPKNSDSNEIAVKINDPSSKLTNSISFDFASLIYGKMNSDDKIIMDAERLDTITNIFKICGLDSVQIAMTDKHVLSLKIDDNSNSSDNSILSANLYMSTLIR